MTRPFRLLTVTHEASRTGAPLQLLSFLEWIREHHAGDVEIHTIVQADGELTDRFESVGGVTVLDRNALRSGLLLAERGLVKLGSRRAAPALATARVRPQLRKLAGYDLTYLNSFSSIEVLPHIPPGAPIVSHVHELNFAMRAYPRPEFIDLLGSAPDRWIAVSNDVADALVDEAGADRDRIEVRHPFIDAGAIATWEPDPERVMRLRRGVGIPPYAHVVMASGTIDWRKGPGLFVQLAAEVRRRTSEPIHFVWVGGALDGPDWERVRVDIERTGADHLHFVGSTPEPLHWFSAADVFVLTSHEDPFPMVCLEHAALGHPIVTYRNGGIVDLLTDAGPDASTGIVDHLDVGAMAQQVIDLVRAPEARARAGEQLRRHVVATHDRGPAAAELYRLLRAAARPPG